MPRRKAGRYRHRYHHGPVQHKHVPPVPLRLQDYMPCGRSRCGGAGKKEGITRSVAAMRKAAADPSIRIFAIGNDPTALFELLRLVREGKVLPALIIGLPVGFVGAAESKNRLAVGGCEAPFTTNIGRKGGSDVAAAVVNALAILAGVSVLHKSNWQCM